MSIPASLANVLQWWSAYFGDHHVVSVGTRFLHLAGIVVGGGTAIAADAEALRARAHWEQRRAEVVAAMAEAHWVVVPAVALVVLTGTLMAAADFDTFLHSRLFWAKMALFAVLLANGAGLVTAERAAARAQSGPPGVLMAVSSVSLLAWLGLLLLGTWLTVGA